MTKIKSCDNCYWTANHGRYATQHCAFSVDKPSENLCDSHDFYCEHCMIGENGDYSYQETAEYEYKGKHYCINCLVKEVGIVKKPIDVNQYYYMGDYIGSDFDNDLNDMIDKLVCRHDVKVSFI